MSDQVPDTARVIARPPLLYAGFLAAGLGADAVWPLVTVDTTITLWIGLTVVLAGVVLGVLAARRFRAAGTSVPTSRPSSALVTRGPYAVSRNPIYVAMTTIYAGIAVAAGSLWTLVLLAPLLGLMRYGVVAREERYLERRFGDPYRAYKGRVRRWI